MRNRGLSLCRGGDATVPTPPLDCGCPCRVAYTITRGATTLTMCAHHGRASETAARAQGFTVIVHRMAGV